MDTQSGANRRKQFQDALLDAFRRPAQLARMVQLGLGVNLSTITGEDDLEKAVFDLYDWAESHGQLAALLRAALAANATNPLLLQVAGLLGVASAGAPAAPGNPAAARPPDGDLAALRAENTQLRIDLAQAQTAAALAMEREKFARAELEREKRARQAAERRLRKDTAAVSRQVARADQVADEATQAVARDPGPADISGTR